MGFGGYKICGGGGEGGVGVPVGENGLDASVGEGVGVAVGGGKTFPMGLNIGCLLLEQSRSSPHCVGMVDRRMGVGPLHGESK